MTFHRDRTRADGTGEEPTESAAGDREESAAGDREESAAGDHDESAPDDHDESAPDDHEVTAEGLTADQHHEWRRWIVETACRADYSVVPIDHIVEEISRREPSEIDRATVRQAVTETILPVLDRESVLDYDSDRELLSNYGK